MNLLVIILYFIADFLSKDIFVVHQSKSLFLKIFLATKTIILMIFKASLFYSLIILIIRVKILNFYKNLYLIIVIDFRVILENVSKL